MNAIIFLGWLGPERMLATNHMGAIDCGSQEEMEKWSFFFFVSLSVSLLVSLLPHPSQRRPTKSLVLTDSRWACYSTKIFSVWAKADHEGPWALPVQLCNCIHLIRNSLYRGAQSSHIGVSCLCASFSELPCPVAWLPHQPLLIVFRDSYVHMFLKDESKEE